VVQTTLRPDIVLFLPGQEKCAHRTDCTVPWEERCVDAYERKAAKYTQLIEECRTNRTACS